MAASPPKKRRGRPPKTAQLAETNQTLNKSLSLQSQKETIDQESYMDSNTEKASCIIVEEMIC